MCHADSKSSIVYNSLFSHNKWISFQPFVPPETLQIVLFVPLVAEAQGSEHSGWLSCEMFWSYCQIRGPLVKTLGMEYFRLDASIHKLNAVKRLIKCFLIVPAPTLGWSLNICIRHTLTRRWNISFLKQPGGNTLNSRCFESYKTHQDAGQYQMVTWSQ